MHALRYTALLAVVLVFLPACTHSQSTEAEPAYALIGCDGQGYLHPESSTYRIPFPAGSTVKTGLANCSASYHGPTHPDRYATDFDAPIGTPFFAARGGKVSDLREDHLLRGQVVGNYVLIDHGDGTSAYYLHSPDDGILVDIGDVVSQGDKLGVVGQSGLAGYPHLHFIVVTGDPAWPYDPVPVSFQNVVPQDVALESHATYGVR